MASLGEELREEREAKGLSREEVAKSLDLQPHYIAAIEEGSSRLVADPFYLVPFLRRYAEALGRDPGQAVGRYLAEVGRRERQGAPQRNSLPAVPRIWLLGVAGVLLVLGASLWFLLF